MTGSGTFENYVSIGASCGATPDGRLSGQPTASDCSQQPHPQVNVVNHIIIIIKRSCHSIGPSSSTAE